MHIKSKCQYLAVKLKMKINIEKIQLGGGGGGGGGGTNFTIKMQYTKLLFTTTKNNIQNCLTAGIYLLVVLPL